MKKDFYLSIDIESDGPIPGRNSMLSFGVAVMDLKSPTPRVPIATFEANLLTADGATPSQSTMDWWKTKPEAWAAHRLNARPINVVMPKFVAWCHKLKADHGANLTVVGYPVTFDFMFVYSYVTAFGGLNDGERCPFGFAGLDIKTLAADRLKIPFSHATKKNMPKHWFDGSPKHDHTALQDAIGQGVLFVNIMLNDRV